MSLSMILLVANVMGYSLGTEFTIIMLIMQSINSTVRGMRLSRNEGENILYLKVSLRHAFTYGSCGKSVAVMGARSGSTVQISRNRAFWAFGNLARLYKVHIIAVEVYRKKKKNVDVFR